MPNNIGLGGKKMVQIDDKIISLDIFEKKFLCDLLKCKGACCIHGDSGAPLEDEEADKLDEIFEDVKPYMRKEAIEAIEKEGQPYMIDSDGDLVTVLVNNKECAFVFFENGITKCAIEKAHFDGNSKFRKPISCHLYPIRVKKYKDFEGLNYDKWDICKPAIANGQSNDLPLYKFLKEPLIRKYGTEWYKQLNWAAEEIKKEKKP